MAYPIPQATLPTTEELLRMALQGTDAEFQRVVELCEDESVALPFFQSMGACRFQVDGWLAYLAELHPTIPSKCVS